jgi:hypothetical protein
VLDDAFPDRTNTDCIFYRSSILSRVDFVFVIFKVRQVKDSDNSVYLLFWNWRPHLSICLYIIVKNALNNAFLFIDIFLGTYEKFCVVSFFVMERILNHNN